MTTTPTPVERAADAILDVHEDGPDAWVEGRVALAAALDVDEIARVIAACDPYADGVDAMHREMAAALVAHLTGGAR